MPDPVTSPSPQRRPRRYLAALNRPVSERANLVLSAGGTTASLAYFAGLLAYLATGGKLVEAAGVAVIAAVLVAAAVLAGVAATRRHR